MLMPDMTKAMSWLASDRGRNVPVPGSRELLTANLANYGAFGAASIDFMVIGYTQ
jgi:hypothetical protein